MAGAKDHFTKKDDMIIAQGRCVRQVTPSDTVDLIDVTKSLFILTTGNICVEPVDGYQDGAGNPITGGITIGVTAGQDFDLFRVRRVYLTGTTATMVAIV